MTSISANSAQQTVNRCTPQDSANPTHASTSMQGGQAVFENDNYRISAGDNDAVTIHNKQTGESYDVWGDPHVNVDGKPAFDFHGTTTLSLEDGTKVTLETTPTPNAEGQTQTSRVTITNGDYGAQISGVDSGKTGDLKINETQGWGGMLDAVVNDGVVLQENPAGQGFVGVDQDGKVHAVDQTYINAAELKNAGENLSPLEKAFNALSTLVSIYVSGHFGSGHQPPDDLQQPVHQPYAQVQGSGTGNEAQATAQTSAQAPAPAPASAPATGSGANASAAEQSAGPLPDPLGVGDAQNRKDHNAAELAADPLGMF